MIKTNTEKINTINNRIKEYFNKYPNQDMISAVEFAIKVKDTFPTAQSLRNFLREIDKPKEPSVITKYIPSINVIRNNNRHWRFVNIFKNNRLPKSHNKSSKKQEESLQMLTSISSNIGELVNSGNFCEITELQKKKAHELSSTGIYCIKLKGDGEIPITYKKHLKNTHFLYIGVATKSLYKRLWQQELNAIGHGTLFRSIGAMLGYRPVKGSLNDKKNKKNFTFQEKDKMAIIQWMDKNTLVNCITTNNFSEEKNLILKYRPLLNITHNPDVIEQLKNDRKECTDIAND